MILNKMPWLKYLPLNYWLDYIHDIPPLDVETVTVRKKVKCFLLEVFVDLTPDQSNKNAKKNKGEEMDRDCAKWFMFVLWLRLNLI